jgi:hypothetical protein
MDFLYQKPKARKKNKSLYNLQSQVSNEQGLPRQGNVPIIDNTIENKLDVEEYFRSLRQSKLSIRKYEPQKKREDLRAVDAAIDIADVDDMAEMVDMVNDKKPKKRTRKKPLKRKTSSVFIPPPTRVDYNSIKFFKFNKDENQILNDRIPKINLEYSASKHHLNNRETFLNFINNTLFSSYLKDSDKNEDITCKSLNDSKSTGEFNLLLHQNLVKDYLNVYSPYRGLFLYFGLGAGKTCSSIAIAEGFNDKQIVVMTPASLQENYVSELKFCGNFLFKKNQFWEKIETNNDHRTEEVLSNILGLSLEDIKKNGGAWMIDVRRPSNYFTLIPEHQNQVEKQINRMLRKKYKFINYNGLREPALNKMEQEGKEINDGNYFNNKVIIIDEVHNFISRIVNKIKKPDSLSMRLYESLMDAENCRIIFLTGTPIINYPNEIAIFFNILRGYIKTYKLKLDTSESSERKIDERYIKSLLKNNPYDYIEYSSSIFELKITANPFKFTNVYKNNNEYTGVKGNENLNEKPRESIREKTNEKPKEHNFLNGIIESLKKGKIKVKNPTDSPIKYKCLPDDLNEFRNLFINADTNTLKNTEMFQRRIMGLTSFYKSASIKLLPKFNNITDIIELKIPMSTYQINIYEQARNVERKQSANNAKKMKLGALYEESTSTYRVFSRACCNFVFPQAIPRPMAKQISDEGDEHKGDERKGDEHKGDEHKGDEHKGDEHKGDEHKGDEHKGDEYKGAPMFIKTKESIDESNFDNATIGELKNKFDSNQEEKTYKDSLSNKVDLDYGTRIAMALQQLSNETIRNKDDANFGQKILFGDNLLTYSPKFHKIMENIANEENIGLHLIYSSFKTMEGIGILKLVLEANGFVQFKLTQKKSGNKGYEINEAELKQNKSFALYTGDESVEEKEMIRLIFNSQWDKINDNNLKRQLKNVFDNNFFGDVIKCLMITSSGAEGITLKNTRFVHVVEPYWHPVRQQQVIGRAVRICSHDDLDESLKNVKVFKYIMTFTDEQLYGDAASSDPKKKIPIVSKELLQKDFSKYSGNKTIVTTDEALNEISNIKETINKNILDAVKFSAIDCKIHNKPNSEEFKQCFTFNAPSIDRYLYKPSYKNDESDKTLQTNKQKINWTPEKISFQGKNYIFQRLTPGKPYGILYDYKLFIDAAENPNALVKYGELKRNKKKLELIRY